MRRRQNRIGNGCLSEMVDMEKTGVVTMGKYQWRMVFVCLLFSLLLLSGCGSFGDVTYPEEALEEADMCVVGFSQLGSESVWRTANSTSIQESLSRYEGYFLVYSNARQKKENQIKALRQFISQRVDYIVFSPMDEEGWDTVLKEAKAAGIPVILVDRKVHVNDESLYTAWVGSDMEEEGRKAGRWLEDNEKQFHREDEPLHIVVLYGTEGATATIGRRNGFMEIAKKHPDWMILEERNGEFTTAKGKQEMEELLKKFSDIDVIVSQNDDMSFGAIAAIEEAGLSVGVNGDMALISFDAVKEALLLVKEGKINVDIECNPMEGDYVKEIIQTMEMGMTVHKNYWVDESVFTIDNVDEYLDTRMY